MADTAGSAVGGDCEGGAGGRLDATGSAELPPHAAASAMTIAMRMPRI